MFSQGSCLDPRWFQDGCHAGIWAEPNVFIGSLHGSTMDPTSHSPRNHMFFKRILLGSATVPGWFPFWELGETMCFHKDPAWIREDSYFSTLHETICFFTANPLGSTMNPRWFPCWAVGDTLCVRRRGPLPGAAVEGGGPRPPQGRPPREVTRFRAKSPQLRCLERKTQSKVTFAPV